MAENSFGITNDYPSRKWDVIIVGAGPGGSIAARECAKRGLKTLVIEKRQEIGAPVRCGEGLGEVWMKKSNLEYDPSWCLFESHGALLVSPSGKEIEIRTKNKGYVIERKRFEKKLAQQAILAGAKYIIKSEVFDVLKEKDYVIGVKARTPEGDFDFKAKLVIAADGVDSKTARFAGINTMVSTADVDSGYEYEMEGLKVPKGKQDLIHLYVGNEVAPRGYVWIFMKSPTLANVGIGITGTSGAKGKTAKYYLDKFIASRPDIFKDASMTEIKGGNCPVGRPMEKMGYNGLALVGDAGRMVNAIHGGGIGNAMEAAMLLAEVAKKGIDKNDVSAEFLNKEYTEKWYEMRGNQ
ncbi:MAG: NAD(P)/FAD-dependent oxidoreductase, partial [Candidatus Micrarchaeota archaeon]